ncbi:MAG: transporter substrate-binding domain-containing protein [Clostridiales bacterium]|nr:transporter substrate-binding domain-containing protein [Clostridiales bacterium]
MKRKATLLIAILLLAAFIPGCEQKQREIKSYLVTDNFDNQSIGIIKNNTSPERIKDDIVNPKIKSYKDAKQGIDALRKGRIEGMILDAYEADYYDETEEDLTLLLEKFDEKQLLAAIYNKPDMEQNYVLIFDAAVSRMKGDGTYNKLMTKYFKGTAEEDYTVVPEYKRVEGRELTIGIDITKTKYVTKNSDGTYSGFYIDLASEVARDHGAELVIKEYDDKSKMIDAVLNNEITIALSDFTEADQIPEGVYYSAPYFDASQYIVILDPMYYMQQQQQSE